MALEIPAVPDRLEFVNPVMVLEPAAMVAPVIVPPVVTLIPVEIIDTVLEAPPKTTPALLVPVPILTAKLLLAFKLTAAPVTVNPAEPVISPEKVGLYTTAKVAVVVPVRLIFEPADNREAILLNEGALVPPDIRTWFALPPINAVVFTAL